MKNPAKRKMPAACLAVILALLAVVSVVPQTAWASSDGWSGNSELGLSVRTAPGETLGKVWKIAWRGSIERINFIESFNVYLDSDDVLFQNGTAVSVAVPIRDGDIGLRGIIFTRSGARRPFLFFMDMITGIVKLVPEKTTAEQ